MPTKLHVVAGTPAPNTPAERVRQRVRAHEKPPCMISCHRCGGREALRTRIGMLLKNGKATGGTEQILCAGCLMRGERVVLL